MGQKIIISAIILKGGKYSENIFKKCLDSINWVDEKIIIDADKFNFSFSELRDMGAMEARGEWLFYIDTDEIVTPELRTKISEIIDSKVEGIGALAIPRKNIVFGQELKHIGLWPDYVIRLIKKDKFKRWHGELHEQPEFEGKLLHLKEPLIHNKHDNISDMLEKTNKWSEIEAKLMFEAGHPKMNFFRFFTAAVREFWLRIILQSAFLDGANGIIYGFYQVYSRLISYSKLWEMQIKSDKTI